VSALYQVRGVSKIYRMGEVEVHALSNVDLDVSDGEQLVILGPSGSGKSTLLNLLGGMDRPTEGTLRFRDEDLSGLDAKGLTLFRRRHVGFVFQFYNLIPSLTALENVAMATEIAPAPRDPGEMIDLVGLGKRRDHFPSQLSGGEQQRVAIARALAKNPDLLLCDEPTGALDFATGKRVLRMLVDLKQRLGKTVVLITHNNAIAPVADRVVRLRSGQIVEVTSNARPVPPEEITW